MGGSDGGDGGGGGGMDGDGGGGGDQAQVPFILTISSTPTINLTSASRDGIAVYFSKPTATLSWSGYTLDHPLVTCSRTSGSVFPIGNTTVTCSAYNYYTGETIYSSYIVSITFVDTTPPTITRIGNSSLTIAQGATYTDAGATAYDSADGNLTASIIRTGSVNTSVVGTYTLTYNVKDTSGNSASAVTRTIIVSDQTAPVITLLGAPSSTISAGTTYTDPGATASDGINGDITSSLTKSGSVATTVPGTYTIVYSVTDIAGNAATPVTRTITVVDTTSPVITLVGANPQTISVGSPYTELGATVTDNVNSGLVATINAAAVNTAVVGSYVVIYTATDARGNTTSATRTVNVIDSIAPVISLIGANPQIIQVGSSYSELGATVIDNVDVGLSAQINTSSVNTSVVGTYSVTYTATDTRGNVAAPVTRTVHVVDTQTPVITLIGASPQVIQVGSAYTELGASVSDNYNANLTATADTSLINTLVVGSYSVIYRVTDASGNVATPVTLIVNVVDTTRPVITLVGTNPLMLQVGSAYVEPGTTVTDNYSSGLIATSNSSTVNTSVVGSYIVSYSVTDSSGNVATTSRVVTIVDTTRPTITLLGPNPQIIAVGTPYVELGATSTDNYSIGLTIINDSSSVNTSTLGTYTVGYSVTDSSGNTATTSRTILVTDTQAPIITLNGSSTQTIAVGSPYTELGASVSDNVSTGLTPTINSASVNTSLIGSYVVTYDVVDGQGNNAIQVVRTINVIDNSIPVIILNGSSTQTINVGDAYIELGVTVSDNYDTGLVATSTGNVNTMTVGSYIITYAVTDSSGNNAAPVSRTVNVIDNQAPVITLLGSNPQLILVGNSYTELGATTTDNYDTNLFITISTSTVNTAVVGTYTVTYTALDSTGNNATPVTRTVNVIDTQAPILTLLGANPQIISMGNSYIEFGSIVNDNIDVGLVATSNSSSVNTSVVGSYTVTYSVTDSSGNVATSSRIVNVIDTTAPVITVTGSSTLSIVVGGVYTELGAVALDVVDGSFAATSTGTVDTATIGTYTITYGATDASGNVAVEVTRTVNVVAAPVVDTTAPVITINGSSTVALLVGDTYTELGATVTDDTDATTTATVVGNVDTTTVGTYTITYTATDLAGNVGTPLTRTVTVSSPVVVVPDVTAPVVTLNGGSVVQVVTGGVYTELGASAFDLVDGTTTVVITGSVDVNATGTYTLTYSSTDAALNIGTATRTVNVVDVITPDVDAPVITVTGSSTLSIVVGGVYTELGAVALDVVDGSFAATSTGTVDTATIGTYTITYGATDAAGNVAVEVTRTVNVVAAPVLSLVTITNSTINGTYYASFNPTIAEANILGFTGSSTIINSTTTASTITESSIINSELVNCTVLDSLVKNYGAINCTISNSIVDPPSGLNDLTGTTASSSQIYVSNVTYSNVTGSYVATSTITASGITNSTSTDSIVATSTITNTEVASSTVITSDIASSTVTSSDVVSSVLATSTLNTSSLTNSTSSESVFTNSTTTDSTISNSTTVSTSLTGTSVVDSTVASSTITNGAVASSTIASSTLNTTEVTSSNITESTLTNSSTTDSTITNTTLASSTVASSTIDSSIITNSTTSNSTLTNSTTTNVTLEGSILIDTALTDSTLINSTTTNTTIANSTIENAVITNGVVLDDIITSGTVFNNGTTTVVTATTSLSDLINYAPIADFTSTISGLSASFADTSTDRNTGSTISDIWTYIWNFGDGTAATTTSSALGNNQSHTYSLSGVYNVILTLIDSAANTSTKASSIVVTAPTPTPTTSSGGGGGTISGGGYFVNTMNTPTTSPFTTNAQPFTFEILPNTQIASSTVTSKVIKAPQQTIKKQVETKKKPVVTKKVTKTSVKVTQPEKQTLWSKMISFIKKFTSGN